MNKNFKELLQIAVIVFAVILFFGWLRDTVTYKDRLLAFVALASECYKTNPNCDLDKLKRAVNKVD